MNLNSIKNILTKWVLTKRVLTKQVLTKQVLNLISNFFYPSFCKFCSSLIEQDFIFCLECNSKIKLIVSSFLSLTPTKKMKIFAVSAYKNPLKKLILEKSYSGNILASKQLGRIIYDRTLVRNLDIDFLIPIPLHWTRFAKRGYNQAYVMAKELGLKLDVPVLDILKRKKRTVYQSSISFAGRQKNVENAFCLKSEYDNENVSLLLKNKNLLFVDDLCTTGATLKNSARCLLKFKPKSINAVVACRVI